jgi:hypothetical protein
MPEWCKLIGHDPGPLGSSGAMNVQPRRSALGLFDGPIQVAQIEAKFVGQANRPKLPT